MKPDFQRRIQRYGWDRAARYYEAGWQEQLWPAQENLLAETNPVPGEKVLDVSCGTGLITLPVAKLIQPDGAVAGVDLSDGMIKEARTRARNQKLNHISFKREDAEALGFPDNSFDVAVCSLGMMYFPDPVQAVREMYRVLASGGRAVTLVWGERKKCGWVEIFPITDRRVKSEVCPLFFQLGTGNTLLQIFEEAGFENTICSRFSYNLHFRDDKQACMAAFLGGAVALAYQKFDEKTRREVDQEYLDSIKQYRNGKGYDVPGEFVIVKGTKPDFSP